MKNYFLLLLSLYALMSCEEVIDVDLNSSEPVLVVDGRIYEGKKAIVSLTMSSDYYTADSTVFVADAVVILSDDKGHSEEMVYLAEGLYQSVKIHGKSGRTYTLEIDNEGEIFSAKTTLMAPVEIYDVVFSESSYGPSQSEEEMEYVMDVTFLDDTLVDNFYMLEFSNDTLSVSFGYFLISDIYTNNDTLIANSRMLTFVEGTYAVKVFSIDEGTFDYYQQLNDLDGFDFGGSTPYNPQSNFGSDVMGYFSASSFSMVTGSVVK